MEERVSCGGAVPTRRGSPARRCFSSNDDFEAAGAGTRLTFSLDAQLTGIRKLLMASPVQKTMDVEVRHLDRLKRVLES